MVFNDTNLMFDNMTILKQALNISNCFMIKIKACWVTGNKESPLNIKFKVLKARSQA